ncbi:MAG: D-sedoheptulose-7-phosphate isomerase [Candidatus Dormibacteria bacterium]
MPSARPDLEVLPGEPGNRWATQVRTYADAVAGLLDRMPVEEISESVGFLIDAVTADRQVLVVGNGGSAATASHLALDLAKGTRLRQPLRLRAIALVDSIPALTAYSNDEDYEQALARQVDNLAGADDVLVAISASGNSANILRAVERAHARGCHVVALTGMGGGRLAQEADVAVVVPSDDIEEVEDAHLHVCHSLVRCVRKNFAGRRPRS